MLKMEKELCDWLIVALQVDPTIDRPGIKNKPTQSVYERYVQVQGCRYVDEILVYETEEDLLNMMIETLQVNNIVLIMILRFIITRDNTNTLLPN
jgi:glycerol-3-phosphate cytidylyltransferase-like family protein